MSEASTAKPKSKGGLIFFLAGFVGMLVVGWFIFPLALYSTKTQPVSFSHVKHLETAGLECQQCHGFREDGTFMGTANMTGQADGACLNCHGDPQAIQGEDPRETAFLEEYVAKGVTHIDWLVYAKQPPCVFFPHAIHVKVAKIDCQHCHGPVAERDKPPVYQQNWISSYSRNIWGHNISGLNSNPWDSMKMSDCADCHEERGASRACFTCHK